VSASKASITGRFATESLTHPVVVPRAALIVALGLMVVAIAMSNPIIPAVAAVGLAVAALVAHRAYGRRMRTAADALHTAASGDLRVRVHDGQTDGLGRLLGEVDAVLADAEQVLVTLVTTQNVITKQHLEMDAAHERANKSVETTSAQASAADGRTREMSELMHAVAASSTQLVESVREIATHASDASQVADAASSQATAASGAVSDLSDASDHVGAIAQMIATIAAQTKLLALNATIEAARAGDAGLGFAVVAAEVKELAGATAVAVKEVSETVHNIGKGSLAARTALDSITDGVVLVNASQASISSAIVEQNAAAYEISRVAADAASESSAIATNVKAMSHFIRRSAYANARLKIASDALLETQQAIEPVLRGYPAMQLAAATDAVSEARNARGTRLANGTTIIQNNVFGSGSFQLDYNGDWIHGDDESAPGEADSCSISAGDSVRLRFVGSRIRVFANCDANHGMLLVSLDGADRTVVDQYAVTRREHAMMWDSGPLKPGEHVWEAEVAEEKNAQSRFYWTTIDRVEVDD
jgi:methyl-accepting chemotaxis protein